jgi:broad-specificity NMP kinase
MIAIYLIGPSGVGKSTACKILEERGLAHHYDLDAVLRSLYPTQRRITVAQYWPVVKKVLEGIEAKATTNTVLVDIGAGTQDMGRQGKPQFEQWLKARSDQVIFLDSEPVDVFAQNRYYARSQYNEFFDAEFGVDRLRLYGIARSTVDTRKRSPEDVAGEVETIIHQLLKQRIVPVRRETRPNS